MTDSCLFCGDEPDKYNDWFKCEESGELICLNCMEEYDT